MRKVLAVSFGVAGLAFAGAAFGEMSYSDPTGDDNAAPDVTSVSVSDATAGTLSVRVVVDNYATLPTNAWFNLWFDLDSDQSTGDAGDEALVRYVADGTIDFYLWNGAELVERQPTGIAAQFAGGALTVSIPRAAFGEVTSFGILAVSSRAQTFGENELVASDFAPNSGRSVWPGAGSQTFPDGADDQDAAPDIAGIRVTDGTDGWIRFAVTTSNYATLSAESLVLLAIDRDNRIATGDDGAELLATLVAGELQLERWNAGQRAWQPDQRPTRARASNANGVVILEIHRSELANAARFGFSVTTADLNTAEESVLGVDFAPDDLTFFRYTMTNRAAASLVAARVSATPSPPRAGKRVTISVPVRRSDTGRPIASGTVSCTLRVGGKRLSAAGSVRAGRARCVAVVPRSAVGALLVGSMTVRSAGAAVTSRFSFRVR